MEPGLSKISSFALNECRFGKLRHSKSAEQEISEAPGFIVVPRFRRLVRTKGFQPEARC